MRLKVVFEFQGDEIIPWDYTNALRGNLYRWLSIGDPDLASFLHDSGFEGGKRFYKLLTFSLLYFREKRVEKGGIRPKGEGIWYFSSPVLPVVESIAFGILTDQEARIGGTRAVVRSVEVEEPMEIEAGGIFKTLSPICLSTGDPRGGEKLHKRFIDPGDKDYERVLNANLQGKAMAFWGEAVEGWVKVEWLGEPKSKMFRVRETNVRGWTGKLRLDGPQRLLWIAYEAGIGEHTSSGFGMIASVDLP